MKFLKWKIIAQNAGNAICGTLDFKIFRGGACPRTPLDSLALRARCLGQHDLFFKASFATELDDIKSVRISTRGSVYGIDDENTEPINGEVVALDQLENEAENVKFWKCGRGTGHTEGAEFRCNHFHANREGFNRDTCYGDLTNYAFKIYCENCKPQIECDLVETSLLEERKCQKCKKEIPKESKKYELWARNCFTLVTKKRPFSEKGDCGAVIFYDKGRAWGIIIGLFETGCYFYTVAISLEIALKALSEKAGKELKLWCVNPRLRFNQQ